MQVIGPKQGGSVVQSPEKDKTEIAGIKINYGSVAPTALSEYGVKLFKDPKGELMMKLGGPTFNMDSNTDRIDFSTGKDGELKINIVDKAKAGFISSREVVISKEGSIEIGKPQKTPVVAQTQSGAQPRPEISFNIPQQQRDEIFYSAKAQAEKELQKQFPGCELIARASETFAKDIVAQPSINPIEFQTFTLYKADGTAIELGNVLPEKRHLQTLKSSEEITQEILTLAKDKAGFKMPSASSQSATTGGKLQNEIPFDSPQPQIDKLFYDGLAQAEAAIKAQFPGGDLIAEPTEEFARGLGRRSINPIEYQAIKYITKDNREIELGKVLPEKSHLQTLKSSAEIRDEILDLAKKGLGYKDK